MYIVNFVFYFVTSKLIGIFLKCWSATLTLSTFSVDGSVVGIGDMIGDFISEEEKEEQEEPLSEDDSDSDGLSDYNSEDDE